MYEHYTPAPLLQPYIDQYWFLRSAGQLTSLQEQIFVDAQADIMFNFGVAYARQNLLGGTSAMTTAHLDAQREYPIAIAQAGVIDLIGIRFRAGGLAAFIRLPLHEASNLTIDLQAIFGGAAGVLEARMYESQDPRERVALLDLFFLQRLAPPPALTTAHYVAERIVSSNGSERIATISDDVGYSIRTVDRLFGQIFGVSPKVYARIVRFQRALGMLGAQPSMPLIDIALLCGYYDQAHFSREFAEFAGDTPLAFRLAILERQGDPPPNLLPLYNPVAHDKGGDQQP
ncbi:MAG: helix-turn-helix domain-containing protein [Chloroflexota bacterium]|nr:helix-turn-helix domain-containing protein [Chloroflexota bacterium]